MECNRFNDNFMIRPRINLLIDNGVKHKITFLSADIGWGKTVAVSHWAAKQKNIVQWINLGESHPISPVKDLIKRLSNGSAIGIIIIEHFHLLFETDEYEEMIEFIKRSSTLLRFILTSRSMIPEELKPFTEIYQLDLITEKELGFDETEINTLFHSKGCPQEVKTIKQMYQQTEGWCLALNILLYSLKQNTGGYTFEMMHKVNEELYSYYDRALFEQWTPEVRRLFLLLSLLDEFSGELVAAVTGYEQWNELLRAFLKKTKYIIRITPITYRLSTFLHNYLERQRNRYLSPEEIQEAYQKAGAWYVAARDTVKAFDYYNRTGSFHKMMVLLEESTEHYIYIDDFDELEELYESMPEEIVMKSPILCSNMVCLHSVCCRIEEAEKWFKRLQSMREMLPEKETITRKRLEERILYTSMILPNMGDRQLIKVLHGMMSMLMSGSPLLQRTSLTGYLPSLLRGYKDFSLWSNHARVMSILMGPVMLKLFQKRAVGVPDIGVAEALYEKNHINDSLLEVTKGLTEVDQRGTADIMYAGYTLLARIMAANGQSDTCRSIMENVRNRLEYSKATRLMPNYKASEVRFDLLSGGKEAAREWLCEAAPDETRGFRSYHSYQYLTKVRVYLQNEMYPQAVALLERLNSYSMSYRRTLDRIECFILQSITLDRIGEQELSMKRLEEAILLAQRHRFIRVFADEGGASYRLLVRYGRGKGSLVKEKFLKEITEAAKSFANLYPHYMVIKNEVRSKLTNAETEILQLIERGMRNGEIAEFLGISIDTVKFHTKNIYSKLSVNNRVQAIRAAKEADML